jgi:hypothetical protein
VYFYIDVQRDLNVATRPCHEFSGEWFAADPGMIHEPKQGALGPMSLGGT